MTPEAAAAEVIKHFEGKWVCPKTAYWDVNAYRLGYGSDTIELSNGSHRKVLKGDCTTEQLAVKDLTRRIKNEFMPKVAAQIGEPYWSKLPIGAKAALTSIGYNYGSITKPAIIAAARTGDVHKIADAVLATTLGDNGGVNDNRRRTEAQIIRDSKKMTLTNGPISNKPLIYASVGVGVVGLAILSIYLYKRFKM